MNVFKLAPSLERFFSFGERAALSAENERCVRHWNRENDCRLCINGCPTGALAFAPDGITLNEEACVGCGLCLHLCPTGVFSGPDETARLFQCVAAIEPHSALDLMCSHFPAATANTGADALVQVEGCLATLGPSAFVGLAALGVEEVRLRLEPCAACPIGAVRARIAESAASACALAHITITEVETPPSTPERRPVHATRAPQLSRRGLLRRFVGDKPAPALLPQAPAPEGKAPPPERRTLLHLLAQLPGERRAEAPHFPTFTVDDSCTACRVCATVCPTGALTFAESAESFALDLAPLACTKCGLCTGLCAPGALHAAADVAYADAVPLTLHAGPLKRCTRCHAGFAGAGAFCPTCAFRRKHPFGSLPRPGTAAPA